MKKYLGIVGVLLLCFSQSGYAKERPGLYCSLEGGRAYGNGMNAYVPFDENGDAYLRKVNAGGFVTPGYTILAHATKVGIGRMSIYDLTTRPPLRGAVSLEDLDGHPIGAPKEMVLESLGTKFRCHIVQEAEGNNPK